MPRCAGRLETIANAGAALALCLSAVAVAETIGSAHTDYDANACAHKGGRAVEDYGEWRCRAGFSAMPRKGDK